MLKKYKNKLICPHCGEDNFGDFENHGKDAFESICAWCEKYISYKCNYYITVDEEESKYEENNAD